MIEEALQNLPLDQPVQYYQAYAEYWFIPILVAIILTGSFCFLLCVFALASQLCRILLRRLHSRVEPREFQDTFAVPDHHVEMANQIERATSQTSRSCIMIVNILLLLFILAGVVISIVGNVRVNEGADELSRALSAGKQRISVDLNRFVSNIESVVNNSPLNSMKTAPQRLKLQVIKNTLGRYSNMVTSGLATVIYYLNYANEIRSIVSWVVLALVFFLSCIGLCGAFGSWTHYSMWMMIISLIFVVMFVVTLGTSAFSLYVVDTACGDIDKFLSGQAMTMSLEGQNTLKETKLYALLKCDALNIVPQTIAQLGEESQNQICTTFHSISCIGLGKSNCTQRSNCSQELKQNPDAALRWDLNDTRLTCSVNGTQTVVDDPKYCAEGSQKPTDAKNRTVSECSHSCTNSVQRLKSQEVVQLVAATKFFRDRQIEADQLYSCKELNGFVGSVQNGLCKTLRDGEILMVAGSTILLVSVIASATIDGVLWSRSAY